MLLFCEFLIGCCIIVWLSLRFLGFSNYFYFEYIGILISYDYFYIKIIYSLLKEKKVFGI